MVKTSPRADYLKSSLLEEAGFRHAFFTRRGGVSPAPYDSLNFSSALGDSLDNVARNVALGAEALGVAPDRVYFLSQVHGTITHELLGHEDPRVVLHTKGDALVSGHPEVACGVRTADCVPVLLAHPETGRVAAAHAGWRGAVAGVVVEALRVMRAKSGTGSVLAAIGPHISEESFEVSDEVAEEIVAASPDKTILDRTRGPRPYVDLRRMIRAQLLAEGLEAAHIDDVHGCTVIDHARFFSYRRDGKQGGRHLSAIVPRRI